MGELYDRMAQDLKLKNLAAKTREQYLRCCSDFVRYHMKSPRELGETAIKQYRAIAMTVRLSALRQARCLACQDHRHRPLALLGTH